MKYILILFCTFGVAKAQTTQQQINYLRQEIYLLKKKVDSLQVINERCCCSNTLYLQRADGIFWWEDQDATRLYLDDRFPPSCDGAKAILTTEDATLYLLYSEFGDGWIIWTSARGGHTSY